MKYSLVLTEKQLSLVLSAVNLMMLTGMGQECDLAEWIVASAHPFDWKNHTDAEFDRYITERDLLKGTLSGVMGELFRGATQKSADVLELETIYDAIKYRSEDKGGRRPMKWGQEPIPEVRNDSN